ncbi:Uncharacterised protein [Serratia grimesii]|nr:Uncharacterised protein [Serratia grimesii]
MLGLGRCKMHVITPTQLHNNITNTVALLKVCPDKSHGYIRSEIASELA